ncbi:proteasome alpha subunit [Candidatus Hakubella thermalkaliphila]|uniref:Proteasome alpha subunit n=1 Tax=Candidatus Hakubella thermalkaliphila TaxID=2754717 RepID=A0A6V8PVT7_9ACTN|nr:proteasome subunit alpha [Candidatus Hakubella thermalkaliphila]GFP19311.1 proteasome alpha subunit [Candidatus Hakubella thermalkaliphila]GFP25606.1 proteasome alpha subunit [Candidatus Hakubella thermalkaliphila]GFP32361.1 proteasome alpha subunit [Candidatus Hakubella thermalkaliphila]GFP35532.1 proteasome alpha subunit [Candidatus Hakubella thermalkaliphila]GFP36729.1 proteasome alpha subunit [Candidatus Hakubella thermalkaliphila]
MPLPFYVSPEQMMKDKADYARKGIARGKSMVALEYQDGIVLVAENPSTTLHKLSEIYDHIAFAGVGKFSEFENLRIAGVRHADLKGYVYSREDVTAKSLANAYSQTLGNIFTQELKPFEVEIMVARVGEDNSSNEIYHILYDGTINDEKGYAAMGGQADEIRRFLKNNYKEDMSLEEAIHLGTKALVALEDRPLDENNLEVAILDRRRERRKFRRISPEELKEILKS